MMILLINVGYDVNFMTSVTLYLEKTVLNVLNIAIRTGLIVKGLSIGLYIISYTDY